MAAFCHFGPNTFNEIEWGEDYGNNKAIFEKAVVSTDKSKLTATVEEAEALLSKTDEYTEETIEALRKEVESAQLVLANEEATQDEIDAAVMSVKAAMDSLKEKTEVVNPENPDTGKPDENESVKPDTNKPNINKPDTGNNSGNSNQSTTQKPIINEHKEVAKTGDTTAVAGVMGTGLFAGGAAALLAFLKRRKKN